MERKRSRITIQHTPAGQELCIFSMGWNTITASFNEILLKLPSLRGFRSVFLISKQGCTFIVFYLSRSEFTDLLGQTTPYNTIQIHENDVFSFSKCLGQAYRIKKILNFSEDRGQAAIVSRSMATHRSVVWFCGFCAVQTPLEEVSVFYLMFLNFKMM